ncbi:aminotransferase class V-fold PLP-dependent enzyme [Mucilaginibacter robiniae]|uniref:Aminotransferase class V-fold PLP-dependent enzyme n=1 Tax=Mucilaginibacter robiniae TaxID=2728022 RepID=A0A7L5DZL6_9SPHI|nr:aminotransferase class V-fold PLP-dependent enzyme [Mucilaginibacter robiniae]QJD95547.1 aminotransferase class V-fold PLP-dependent enzyme [Mucilaginibacter robiniae]
MTFTEQFPVLNNYTYVNTASSGILSQSLLNWRRQHDMDFMEQGSNFRLPQADFLQQVKNSVARLFHSNVENTFLVPNFSYGFNILLDGLPGKQRVLLVQEDYPSINYPVKSRGYAYEHVVADELLEQNLLARIEQFKPTLLAFSLVQYISGIKIDPAFIKTLKHTYPELLLVADGTQYCGTEPFNFVESGLDALMASGYKWMLSGYGNGFALLNENLASQLYAGNQQKTFPSEPFLQGRSPLSFYFEPGHQDTLTFGSLKQAIADLEQTGLANIASHIQQLSQQALNAFADRGLLAEAILKRKQHSSIFNLNLTEQVFNQLQQAGVLTSLRGPGIRVSFHFYNTEQDLERLLEVIDQHR